VIEAKETETFLDLTMSSDDELVQGSSKKVKLSHPRPRSGKDAEKALTLALTESGASAEAGAPTTDCAPSEGNAPTAPANTEAECLVATPPATSPTLGACEDAPITISEGSLTVTPEPTSPVPDGAPPNNDPLSRSSTPDDYWCADDYGVFNPDDRENFPFASVDRDIFTDPYAYKEYILECAMMEFNERKFRRNLQDCLRGSARTWYERELNDEERDELREGFLEDWLDCLIRKFHANPDEAMELIKDAPWDWSYVRKGNEPEHWLEYQFGCARQVCEYHWEALHLIWEQIIPEMRGDVPEPVRGCEYQGFLEDMEEANEKWRKKVGFKGSKGRSR
jgi:hypothetical protein